MASVHTVRWGILATGWIADQFVKDLLRDPASRGVSDVKHEVAAVASSSSQDRAKQFIQSTGSPSSARAYGSYTELVKDPHVDIIYVATPHSHHYQNVMLCLEAGKPVLCEKAFTVNAAQTRRLIEVARSKRLFLMEAVWTRFFPLSIKIRRLIEDGALGAVHRVIADVSFGENVETKYGKDHRMVNLDLAGGVLLDLGIYSLTWVFQTLYHTLPPQERKPPKVASHMVKYKTTGSDESTSVIMTFPRGPKGAHWAQGIATSNLRVGHDPDHAWGAGPAIRIQGTKGEIQVFPPGYRPTKWRVVRGGETGKPEVEEHIDEPPGHGMFWEADEAARCLRDGKFESAGMSWQESIDIMDVMDTVRKQNDLKYSDKLETLDFPVDL